MEQGCKHWGLMGVLCTKGAVLALGLALGGGACAKGRGLHQGEGLAARFRLLLALQAPPSTSPCASCTSAPGKG